MGLTNDKMLKGILKSAENLGWVFNKHKRHIKGKHPNGQTVTISVSPGDFRAIRNIQRDLKLRPSLN